MYHVSAQGVDECMINVHYYYFGDTSCGGCQFRGRQYLRRHSLQGLTRRRLHVYTLVATQTKCR